MMKKLSKIGIKFGGLVASCALLVGVASVNAACPVWFHQPKVPKGMSKFKR